MGPSNTSSHAPTPQDDKSGGEGVAADAAGNVFGAENVGKGLRKYAKQ